MLSESMSLSSRAGFREEAFLVEVCAYVYVLDFFDIFCFLRSGWLC